MSDAASKISNYYARGQKPMSVQEVEQVLALHPYMKRPQNIIVLDGDVITPQGVAVGLTPSWENTMILSAIADQETVTHELVHSALGMGEMGTRLVTPLLRAKEKVTLFPKPVSYRECKSCEEHPELFQKYGLVPTKTGQTIRYYVLEPEKFAMQFGIGLKKRTLEYPDINHWCLVGQ